MPATQFAADSALRYGASAVNRGSAGTTHGRTTVNVAGCGPATGAASEDESASQRQMRYSPAVYSVVVSVTVNAPFTLLPLTSMSPESAEEETAHGVPPAGRTLA